MTIRVTIVDPTPAPPTCSQHIIDAVAADHRVSVRAILGATRYAPVVRARHEAMARVRDELGYSYPHIALIFDRCHDVVIRGIRRHRAGHPKNWVKRLYRGVQPPSAEHAAQA